MVMKIGVGVDANCHSRLEERRSLKKDTMQMLVLFQQFLSERVQHSPMLGVIDLILQV